MIFILPAFPKNGEAAILWGLSMRPLTDTPMVESRIARSIVYRDAYLNKLRKERPKVYAAAVAFAQEMRTASEKWPERTYLLKGTKDPITEEEMASRAAKGEPFDPTAFAGFRRIRGGRSHNCRKAAGNRH